MDHILDILPWVLGLVLLGIGGGFVYSGVRRLTALFHRIFGAASLLETVCEISQEATDVPRALNACENSVLPRILEDFPDFDVNLVKTYARDYIKQQLADKNDLTIHNVVLSQYLTGSVQKAVVLQAAVSWVEDGKVQKRFDLTYTYKLARGTTAVGANCPNCGATIGYGQRECPYSGSRVVNALGQSWKFTELRET